MIYIKNMILCLFSISFVFADCTSCPTSASSVNIITAACNAAASGASVKLEGQTCTDFCKFLEKYNSSAYTTVCFGSFNQAPWWGRLPDGTCNALPSNQADAACTSSYSGFNNHCYVSCGSGSQSCSTGCPTTKTSINTISNACAQCGNGQVLTGQSCIDFCTYLKDNVSNGAYNAVCKNNGTVCNAIPNGQCSEVCTAPTTGFNARCAVAACAGAADCNSTCPISSQSSFTAIGNYCSSGGRDAPALTGQACTDFCSYLQSSGQQAAYNAVCYMNGSVQMCNKLWDNYPSVCTSTTIGFNYQCPQTGCGIKGGWLSGGGGSGSGPIFSTPILKFPS